MGGGLLADALRMRVWHTVALGLALGGCYLSHELGDSRDGGRRDFGAGFDGSFGHDGGILVERDASLRDSGPHDGPCVLPPVRDGVPPVCPGPLAAGMPACGEPLCGNGVVDHCPSCRPCNGGGPPGPPRDVDAGRCCDDLAEACDGAEVLVTCASLGYGPGTVRCGTSCTPDPRGCDACACDDRIEVCGQLPIDSAGATSLSMAVSDDGYIGLAWSGVDGSVHFARLDRELHVIDEPPCMPRSDGAVVSLAGTPSGWLLAVSSSSESWVLPLAANGALRGVAANVGLGGHPMLVGRPGGAPLLILAERSSTSDARALMLDDATGGTRWSVPLVSGVVEPEYASGAWTGEAFVIAERVYPGIVTMRVGLDGVPPTAVRVGGDYTEYPKLAWGAGGGRITWADFGGTPTVLWQTLDASGAGVGDVVVVSRRPSDYAPAPIAVDGEETVVFLPGDTGWTGHGGRVAVERLDATGAAVTAAFRVDAQPEGFWDYRVAMLGSDAVLAWIGPAPLGGIVAARVRVE